MIYKLYKNTSFFILLCFFIFTNDINAAINIYTSGVVVLHNNGHLKTSGDWSDIGTFNNETGSSISFFGNNDISLSNTSGFSNLIINKTSGNILLEEDLNISENINFVKGNILTNSKTVNLSSTATITGESNAGYILGNAKITCNIGTQASNFGGIGVSLNSGSDNLGNVEVIRTSGNNGHVAINGKVGINRKWKISSANQPVNGRDLTLTWVSNDDNSANLNFAKLWKSENQSNWNTVGNMQNASSHTITVPVNSLAYFTVNSASTINLPDEFSFDEDGSLSVDFSNYIEGSGSKKDYSLYLKKAGVTRLVKKSKLKKAKSYTIQVSENTNISAEINGDIIKFTAPADWNGTENLKFTLKESKLNEFSKLSRVKASYFDYAEIKVLAVNDSMEIKSYFPAETSLTLASSSTQKFSLEVEDIDNSFGDLEFKWFINDELQSCSDSVFTANIAENGNYTIKGSVSDGEYTEEIVWNVSQQSAIHDNFLPKTNKLCDNYPNPFNPTTHINYQLKAVGNISIMIYNYKGEKVRTLVNSIKNPGFYSVTWNGKNDYGRALASGVYFYSMKTKDYCKIKRAVLVK